MDPRAERPSSENPAQELAGILWRRKWTIVTVSVVATAVIAAGTLREPPRYEAEASLLVRIGREYVYRPEIGRNENARMPSLAEIVNSEVEILSSRDLAEQVVGELGASKLYPDLAEQVPDVERMRELAVRRFRDAASARPVLESSVIRVVFEHEDPVLAAQSVNLLVERFKDKHIEVFGEDRSTRLGEQLTTRRDELATAEQALATFKAENQVFDLDEQRRLLLSQRLRLSESLEEKRVVLAAQRLDPRATAPEDGEAPLVLPAHLRPEMRDELLRQLHDLERELRAYEPPPADRLIEQASLRLLELELRESELRRTFSPENREVKGVQAEIASVREFLSEAERRAGQFDEARRREREAGARALETRIVDTRNDLALLVAQGEREVRRVAHQALAAAELEVRELEQSLTGLAAEIQRLDQQERRLRELERARDSAESALQLTRERLDEARLTEELDREKAINVRVIEAAAPPVEPSGLAPKLKLALGAFVGVIAGVALAILLDLFRPRPTT